MEVRGFLIDRSKKMFVVGRSRDITFELYQEESVDFPWLLYAFFLKETPSTRVSRRKKANGALLLRIHWKRIGEVFPHKLNGNKALSFSAVAALLLLYRYI